MDRKSLIVLVICGVLFFAWPILMQRLYPPKPRPLTNGVVSATNVITPAPTAPTAPPAGAGPATNAVTFIPPAPDSPEELLVLSNENARVTFTSHGGGIKQVDLLKYPETIVCSRKQPPASAVRLNAQAQWPVLALANAEFSGDGVFRLSKTQGSSAGTNASAGEVVRAEKLLTNGVRLVKEFSLGSGYLIGARVRFENRSGAALALPPQNWIAGTATPLNAQDGEQKVGLLWSNGSKQQQADNNYFLNRGMGCLPGTPRAEYRVTGEPVAWTAAQNQFFFVALMPKVPGTEISAAKFTLPPPRAEEVSADSKTLTNQFAIQVVVTQSGTNLAPGTVLEREFNIYAGPKEYRTLERIGADLKSDLEKVMGFGWFGFFSKVLLLSMNGLHALGLSYGLAIIAITVIIKLLFWPLTQASTRSMKRMQALQPQMKAIQEKYKEDPTRMNKKMMEFMRENKVSPLGGCLPVLLQIPVFIGFFQMVQSAIELRGAKFLWACDLSRSDTILVLPGLGFLPVIGISGLGLPINPLPLLMGVTMFWQARLTPPSPGMDPAQQRIMKYFPLIFLFVLYNYSAGLTLYWTVQNLLSIAQMKLTRATETRTGAPGKPAAPAAPAPRKKS